jgi:hypothetical protein
MSIKILDLPLLEECFLVDFETGVLTWKVRPMSHFVSSPVGGAWNTKYANKIASFVDPEGYKRVTINYSSFKHHRIIFGLFHNDSNPPPIDHFDGDKTNNGISNLRPALGSINHKNTAKKKSNTSGITGVCLLTHRLRWVVRIDSDEKRISKTFKDFFEACCFRKSMEIKLNYSARHGT